MNNPGNIPDNEWWNLTDDERTDLWELSQIRTYPNGEERSEEEMMAIILKRFHSKQNQPN